MEHELQQVESLVQPQIRSSKGMPRFVIEGGVITFHHHLDGGRGNTSQSSNGNGHAPQRVRGLDLGLEHRCRRGIGASSSATKDCITDALKTTSLRGGFGGHFPILSVGRYFRLSSCAAWAISSADQQQVEVLCMN